MSDIDQLREFARDVLRDFCMDLDGNDLFELGRKHGLLAPVRIDKPCGDECTCAEYGSDFPTECYRWTDILRKPALTTP